MEFTLFNSMSRTLILGTVCSCMFLTSCSSDDDPVKSYSNYQITVDTASPVSFNALGETKAITVSATKEICWDGKPSGEKEGGNGLNYYRRRGISTKTIEYP